MPHNYQTSKPLTVASGGTTSAGVEVEAFEVMGMLVPTIDNGTFKLQVSQDNSNYFDIYDGDGTQVLLWAASTGSRALCGDGNGAGSSLRALAGFKYVRVVLGAAQTADRTFTLVLKDPGY